MVHYTHTCTRTHTHFSSLFFYCLAYPLLCAPRHYISLHHCHCSLSHFSSLLWEVTSFTTLSGKQPCSFSSQSPICSPFFVYILYLIHLRVLMHPDPSLACSNLRFFRLVGEPSWSPGNGNHPPHRWGYFWTYICDGWEPWIPYKGWCEFQIVCLHACICSAVAHTEMCLLHFALTHCDAFSGNSAWTSKVILTWQGWAINKWWYINHDNPAIFLALFPFTSQFYNRG